MNILKGIFQASVYGCIVGLIVIALILFVEISICGSLVAYAYVTKADKIEFKIVNTENEKSISPTIYVP